jgi:hypothetical protein
MTFYRYPKIHTLGKEENEGILQNYVYIQEKVDGANASIWNENGVIKCGKRSGETSDFNGLPEYVATHPGINKFLMDNPTLHLFGEWLVRHTIHYNETAYKKFYLFDIGQWVTNEEGETVVGFMPIEKVYEYAAEYDIPVVQLLWEGNVTDESVIKEQLGKTNIGEVGEGVVIKPRERFANKFGDFVYAKVVREEFKEMNGLVFGGNNKTADHYHEMYVCNKYMTLARVQKILQKIESNTDTKLTIKDTPRVSMSAYNDMLVEEIWSIQKDVDKISFKALKNICSKKAVIIFHDILKESLSVAYFPKDA